MKPPGFQSLCSWTREREGSDPQLGRRPESSPHHCRPASPAIRIPTALHLPHLSLVPAPTSLAGRGPYRPGGSQLSPLSSLISYLSSQFYSLKKKKKGKKPLRRTLKNRRILVVCFFLRHTQILEKFLSSMKEIKEFNDKRSIKLTEERGDFPCP